MPKIWFRESKQAYSLQIDRHTQKRLGKTRAEADAAYRRWIRALRASLSGARDLASDLVRGRALVAELTAAQT